MVVGSVNLNHKVCDPIALRKPRLCSHPEKSVLVHCIVVHALQGIAAHNVNREREITPTKYQQYEAQEYKVWHMVWVQPLLGARCNKLEANAKLKTQSPLELLLTLTNPAFHLQATAANGVLPQYKNGVSGSSRTQANCKDQ
eukprot:516269-Amphidinium_carterae.1